MANRIWNAVSLVVALSAPLVASQVLAQDATCRPGDILCGEVQVGPFQGQIRVGPGDAPPPPVVVQPPPPPVVIQAPPPPVVIQAPPPPVVAPPTVVVQAPPPPVVVQPQPQVITQRGRVIATQRTTYRLVPDFDLGLHLSVGGMFTDRVSVGGGALAFRIRPNEFIGIDIGIGLYGGTDAQNIERFEMPGTVDLLVFFNPEDSFQVYGLIGVGASYAEQGQRTVAGRFIPARDLAYLGGELGLGFEWRLARHFALNLDVRGFLREQVGPATEFSEVRGGSLQTTNTSIGATGNLGMTFYFIGL